MLNVKALAKYVNAVYPMGIQGIRITPTHLFIWYGVGVLYSFVFFLRKHTLLKFESLLDIWGVDFLYMLRRFEVNYLLVSLRFNLRVVLRLHLQEPVVKSVVGIYFGASWLEREVWDMFGIFFVGHNDLRRILTDYGFSGFPLRKDFPLSGFKESLYADGEKRVTSVKLRLLQEFRNFVTSGRWLAT